MSRLAIPEREMELAQLSQGTKEAQSRADEHRSQGRHQGRKRTTLPKDVRRAQPSLVRSLQGQERAT